MWTSLVVAEVVVAKVVYTSMARVKVLLIWISKSPEVPVRACINVCWEGNDRNIDFPESKG